MSDFERGRSPLSRRLLVSIGLLAAAAVTLASGLVAAHGQSASTGLRAWGFGAGHSTAPVPHITRARQITMRAHDFVATPVDNDPTGTSQGDFITVEGLLSSRSGDSTIGRLDVNEVFTGLPPGGGARLLITVTASLAAGQITAVGVGGVSASGKITIKLPIAGGAGKYRNVRGVLIANTDTNSNTTQLTYLLIP
jgi:hypothetical protein